MVYDLKKFTEAHQQVFSSALCEIRNGKKRSHWIWYIFPQMRGLGLSSTSDYYGMHDLDEAAAFLADPYLGANLRKICNALLQLPTNNALAVLGSPDHFKLRSSMTLFALAAPNEPVFREVLQKYFDGKLDHKTLDLLNISDF